MFGNYLQPGHKEIMTPEQDEQQVDVRFVGIDGKNERNILQFLDGTLSFTEEIWAKTARSPMGHGPPLRAFLAFRIMARARAVSN